MFDLSLGALALLDPLIAEWSRSGAPAFGRLMAWLSDLPAALVALRQWQHILAPAAGLGAVVGLVWRPDPHLSRSHPLVQRLSNAVGFAAFGLLCGFGAVLAWALVAPFLGK